MTTNPKQEVITPHHRAFCFYLQQLQIYNQPRCSQPVLLRLNGETATFYGLTLHCLISQISRSWRLPDGERARQTDGGHAEVVCWNSTAAPRQTDALLPTQPYFPYLCLMELPRSLRGICGDQRGTDRVSGERRSSRGYAVHSFRIQQHWHPLKSSSASKCVRDFLKHLMWDEKDTESKGQGLHWMACFKCLHV